MKKLIRIIKAIGLRSTQTDTARLNYVEAPSWEIDAPSDCILFFRNIAKIMPEGSVLFIEGTNICEEAEKFYKQQNLHCDLRFVAGTIWPKPRFYHIPIRRTTVEKIAELAGTHAWPEICDHLRIHDGNRLLLHWFDFPHDPIIITGTIGEMEIRTFCEQLVTEYRTS